MDEDIVETSIKAGSDYLSLNAGATGEVYKKYGRIVSPMGCRAYLSNWFERGGMYPADENDKPVFVGRFNVGK